LKDDISSLVPAGLNNLGATCYVNSVLQCLFMNVAFRRGLYLVESKLACSNGSIVHQLQALFAELQSGVCKSVDSTDFISSVQIDRGVQQDGQEFLKLLLSLLESQLAKSQDQEVQQLVQGLFKGRSSYATTCETCGRASDASRRLVDFYELELNVKGIHTLAQSLEQYLSEERLDGDNQYSCDFCKTSVDACRKVRIHALPTYLCFQLKRFVFDLQTLERKKATDRFRFPQTIDMKPHVTQDGWGNSNSAGERQDSSASASVSGRGEGVGRRGEAEGGPTEASEVYDYELAAILLHKGASARSGHYVAHVKHEITGQWWLFDDETVTLLGEKPFGRDGDGGDNGEMVVISDDGEARTIPRTGQVVDPMFSSCNAYLLIYRQKFQQTSRANEDPCVLQEVAVPPHLSEMVEAKNVAFRDEVEVFQGNVQHILSETQQRQDEVRELIDLMPFRPEEGLDGSMPFRWISADWLRMWADGAKYPPEIDNRAAMCAHEKLDPSKCNTMKRISVEAWDALLEKKYELIGRALTEEDWCDECLRAQAQEALETDKQVKFYQSNKTPRSLSTSRDLRCVKLFS
jgi:ubiquitin carboxyl-terminal hydrolase 48